MSDVRTDAALTRLAAILGVERARVVPFAPAGAEALHELADQISDALLEEHRPAFERVAALAERLPAGIAVRVSEKVLGPLLGARTAAAMRPEKSAELAERLDPAFLADVAGALDPRHCAKQLAAVRPKTAVDVARVLEARDEPLPLGMLMSEVSPAALLAGVEALQDRTILRAGQFVRDPKRLGEVVASIDDARLTRLAEVAAAEGLSAELDDLLARVPEREAQRARAALAAG